MSKGFKGQHNQDFQAMINQYFNSVLLDFDNVKEINAILTAFKGEKANPKTNINKPGNGKSPK